MDMLTAAYQLGVPAALSIYLVLWITKKLNGKLDKLTASIERLNSNIERLNNIIMYKLGDGRHE